MNSEIGLAGYLSLILLGLVANSAAATCRTDIPASTPDQDFTLHNDGTVTHSRTGLIWMRCSLGQSWDGSTCLGSASAYTWTNALAAVQSHNFAGHNDWRLPNKNELASIVERRCTDPAINSMVFPNTPGNWYWSSSPLAIYANAGWEGFHARDVDFGNGDVYTGNKFGGSQVRLVRAGQ